MDKPNRNKYPISFRLSPETLERIRLLAKRDETTRTAYIERLIKKEADKAKIFPEIS